MKRHPLLSMLFCSGMLFSVLISSCNHDSNTNDELEKIRKDMFTDANGAPSFPIYADPPTGDYAEVKRGIFSFQMDSTERKKVIEYRSQLEPFILQHLDSGFSWVYLAAWLRYDSAVPHLRKQLLTCNSFYGWESSDTSMESYRSDNQYCFQLAYISAIEYITGKPISKAITLTDQERAQMKSKADRCNEGNMDSLKVYCPSRWLLNRLDAE